MMQHLRSIGQAILKGLKAFGRFQSALLIALVYIIILSPIGLLARLIGWDPLDRRGIKKKSSNWQPVEKPEPDLESLRHQS